MTTPPHRDYACLLDRINALAAHGWEITTSGIVAGHYPIFTLPMESRVTAHHVALRAACASTL